MCNKAQATNIVNAEKTPKHNPVFFLIFFFYLRIKYLHPTHLCSENSLFIPNRWCKDCFNPFVPNAPFLYTLKISRKPEDCKPKGCIGSKWVSTSKVIASKMAILFYIISYSLIISPPKSRW